MNEGAQSVTLFLCGDVMTGRGVDQILPHPSEPSIYESYMHSALGYVSIAEEINGPIPRPVEYSYVWGDALAEITARAPDWRIVNLETSVTTASKPEPKGINYRMHPSNLPCLQAASVDCCVLANNHVLDWGVAGLLETLDTLQTAGIATTGAGRQAEEASRPAVLSAPGKGRVLVFGFGTPSSGVPLDWSPTTRRPGVNVLQDFSARTARKTADQILGHRQPGDIVVVSLHWGGNWGYEVPREHREFAHSLIDAGSADVVHGHSSHHPKGIEYYRGRPILFGCGDFLNDYEGISGYEDFRPDLVLAYFVSVDVASGDLTGLVMVPFRTRRFRLERADRADAVWLQEMLNREGRALGTAVVLDEAEAASLRLTW